MDNYMNNLNKSRGSEEEKEIYCDLPPVPDRQLDEDVSPNVMSLIRRFEKKWVNHTVLHYCFLDSPAAWQGDETQKQAVRDAFTEWKALNIGLEFREVQEPGEAEVRIAFQQGAGSWSYVGRDVLYPGIDPNDRTMNYGWNLTTDYGHNTALHEIGHVLGFPHEHQNPAGGIVWNEETVYDYFGDSPNYWDRDKTYRNVIKKISPEAVEGSPWDKDSVMHYRFAAGLIVTPEEYQTRPLVPELGLSDIDIQEVRKFYPGDDGPPVLPELVPYLSQLVRIEPGEQLDFVIHPLVSRRYTMQTFGSMDTVMVLFEDVNGEPTYIAGDDDSGTRYNARIEQRLLRNRTYYLRLRLYHSRAAGEGGIMLW